MYVLTNNMTISIENPKELIKKNLLELISNYSRVMGYETQK
jgi:hypothetical protein